MLIELFLLAVVLLGADGSEASVENWTPEQRAANRDLVVKGKIKHVLKARNRTNTRGAETWGGVIIVEETLKGNDKYKKGDLFPFWFEQGLPTGKGKPRKSRTPPFPQLKGGSTGTFYLTLMSPEDKEQLGEKPTNAHLYMIETSFDFAPQ